jgi:single-strand DNA-binding protein
MNKVILSGRTTADPELRYLPGNGTAICSFALAVKRNRKNAQGEYESDFINCQAWAKSGELIAEYVKKGQVLTISGRLQIRKYDKDGVNHWISEIVVEDFDFPQKQHNENNSAEQPHVRSFGHEVNLDDDIPF